MNKQLMVLFGPPGSGKSTQARQLEERLGLKYVSWGSIARAAISQGGPLASSLAEIEKNGSQIPLDVSAPLFRSALQDALSRQSKGVVVDGFPRRREEAAVFLSICDELRLEISAVVRFNLDFETLSKRIAARLMCTSCSAQFSAGEAGKGLCPNDGQPLTSRHDDNPVTLRKRYDLYIEESVNAFDALAARSPTSFDVDANADEVVLFSEIVTKLQQAPKAGHRLYRQTGNTLLETDFGLFRLVGYQNVVTYDYHLALVKGDVAGARNVTVRLHSSCITGDIFGSQKCDCGLQLHSAMRQIEEAGKGVILYLFQEGRGINILNKIEAYRLQRQGLDTVEANERLGLPQELRDYVPARDILRDLQVRSIDLMTNNPHKMHELQREGVIIEKRVPLVVPSNPNNEKYRQTQAAKMGHVFATPVIATA